MKYQVVDLQQNVIEEFDSEFEMDRWLIDKLCSRNGKIGQVKTRIFPKRKQVEIEETREKSDVSCQKSYSDIMCVSNGIDGEVSCLVRCSFLEEEREC